MVAAGVYTLSDLGVAVAAVGRVVVSSTWDEADSGTVGSAVKVPAGSPAARQAIPAHTSASEAACKTRFDWDIQ